MTKEQTHSTTPWDVATGYHGAEIYANGTIARIPDDMRNWEANAAFIVKACNCHDELIEALKTLSNQADSMNNRQHAGLELMPGDWSELFRFCNIARETLQKAKGEL